MLPVTITYHINFYFKHLIITLWLNCLTLYYDILYYLGGYTKCHSFEFFPNGDVKMKEYVDSDDSKSYLHKYVTAKDTIHVVKTNLMRDLFGESVSSLEVVCLNSLKLKKSPIVPIKSTKIVSISNVLFAVPKKYRNYYPDVDELDVNDLELTDDYQEIDNRPAKKNKSKRPHYEFDPSKKSKSQKKSPSESINESSILKYLVEKPSLSSKMAPNVISLEKSQKAIVIDSVMTPPPVVKNELFTGQSMSSVSANSMYHGDDDVDEPPSNELTPTIKTWTWVNVNSTR